MSRVAPATELSRGAPCDDDDAATTLDGSREFALRHGYLRGGGRQGSATSGESRTVGGGSPRPDNGLRAFRHPVGGDEWQERSHHPHRVEEIPEDWDVEQYRRDSS